MFDSCLRSLLETWNLREIIPQFERFQITLLRLTTLSQAEVNHLAPAAELRFKLQSLINYLQNNINFKQIELLNKEVNDKLALHSNLRKEKDDTIIAFNAKITQLDTEMNGVGKRLTSLQKTLDSQKNDLKRSVEAESTQVAKRLCVIPTVSQQAVSYQTVTTVTIPNPKVANNQNSTVLLQLTAPENGSVTMAMVTNVANEKKAQIINRIPLVQTSKPIVEKFKFAEHKYKFEVVEVLNCASIYSLQPNKKVSMDFHLTDALLELASQESTMYRIVLRMSRYRRGNQKRFYDSIPTQVTFTLEENYLLELPTKKEIFEAPFDVTEECTEENENTVYLETKSESMNVVAGVYFIRLLTVDEAMKKFVIDGKQRKLSLAKKKLMDTFKCNDDVCPQSLSVPLICPLSKKRIEIAAVGLDCAHVSCFDLKSFLACNINSMSWMCPICDKTIKPDYLVVDSLLSGILNAEFNDTKVEFDSTGKLKERVVEAASADLISID